MNTKEIIHFLEDIYFFIPPKRVRYLLFLKYSLDFCFLCFLLSYYKTLLCWKALIAIAHCFPRACPFQELYSVKRLSQSHLHLQISSECRWVSKILWGVLFSYFLNSGVRQRMRKRERERNWEREKEGESRGIITNNNIAATLMLTDTHGLTDVHAPLGSLATTACRCRRCLRTSPKPFLVSPSRLKLVSGSWSFHRLSRSHKAAGPPTLRLSPAKPRSRRPPILLFSRSSLANPQNRKVAGFQFDPPNRLLRSRLLPVLRSSRPPPPLSSANPPDHLPWTRQPSWLLLLVILSSLWVAERKAPLCGAKRFKICWNPWAKTANSAFVMFTVNITQYWH